MYNGKSFSNIITPIPLKLVSHTTRNTLNQIKMLIFHLGGGL
jgi:hypothetical protein